MDVEEEEAGESERVKKKLMWRKERVEGLAVVRDLFIPSLRRARACRDCA